METNTEGADSAPSEFNFVLVPVHKPETLLDNVRSAVARELPEVKECSPHGMVLSIAGGGPSLEDTWQELHGYIAAVNGSLSYLLKKGVVPHLCGVCDPSPHMAEVIEAHAGVTYFVASHCDPSVFDKLLSAGCRVYLWHLHPIDGLDALLSELYPNGWLQIPGGSTMGLRWVNLAYNALGFRKFHLHGMDSSFRDRASHAYPDHQDDKEWITFDGFKTRVNFVGQVVDFMRMLDELGKPDVEPTEIRVFGDGLLQSRFRHWLKTAPAKPKCSMS
jgi:uncharacterized Rossmann fold enzyme